MAAARRDRVAPPRSVCGSAAGAAAETTATSGQLLVPQPAGRSRRSLSVAGNCRWTAAPRRRQLDPLGHVAAVIRTAYVARHWSAVCREFVFIFIFFTGLSCFAFI